MDSSREPVSFLATDAPEAARVFYGDVMGLELREATPFALVFAEGGHLLRVQIVDALRPAAYTAHGWAVADLDHDVETLTAKGVAFLRFGQLPQDQRGIWTTPDGSRIAWFADPSGNILSLTEYAKGSAAPA